MRFWSLYFALIICVWGKPIVSVSIPPQAYFVQQIAQDSIQVNTLIPQGSDPHTFEFKPQSLGNLSKSDLYLTIGLEFEKVWIPKIKDNFPKLPIHSITQGVQYLHQEENHHHDHDHDHEEDSKDPHIWLSPIIAKTLAQNIASILSSTYPQHAKLYAKNLEILLVKIDKLNTTISAKLQSIPSRYFIVYHPSWGYFANTYHLTQIPIELEGKSPSPKVLNQTIKTAQKYKVKTIFVQNGFSTQSAQSIAKSCGAKIFATDPLAYDWERELLKIADELSQQ